MADPSARPRIAVTCDFEHKTDARGAPAPRFWLSETYVRTLSQAGADPYILPHLGDIDEQRAKDLLGPMQALVVSGGAFDIDPALYGQAKHPSCGPLAPTRTRFEAQLLKVALARDLPVLGVCGGMQLMAVLGGGSLYQDVSLRPHTDVHEQPFDKTKPSHSVRVRDGSLLRRLTGQASLEVNSTHHQLVHQPGSYEPSGHSPDGVIEALEDPSRAFCLGVQWHPEALPQGVALYKGLVEAARAFGNRRP
jgi:putative glutamine amidotransferase